MLNKLEARFRLAGYKHIHFIIVSSQTNNTQDDNIITKKLKIRKSNRTMNISENLKNMASNVTVLNGDADSENEYFRDFIFGSAYVFDQCSRLTYIIYYPWSSIQRPYVKASILSTIYDAPCGECNVSLKLLTSYIPIPIKNETISRSYIITFPSFVVSFRFALLYGLLSSFVCIS